MKTSLVRWHTESEGRSGANASGAGAALPLLQPLQVIVDCQNFSDTKCCRSEHDDRSAQTIQQGGEEDQYQSHIRYHYS